MIYKVIRKKSFWWHCSFVLLLSQSACSLSIPRSLQTLQTDPPRLLAFLQQPDYFLSFDKWLPSLKTMKKKSQRIKEKTKAIKVVYGSDLLLHRLRTLLSLFPTQDSLATTVYFDMWNSSHTSTLTQMHIPGSMVVISLALGAGMTSWGRRR